MRSDKCFFILVHLPIFCCTHNLWSRLFWCWMNNFQAFISIFLIGLFGITSFFCCIGGYFWLNMRPDFETLEWYNRHDQCYDQYSDYRPIYSICSVMLVEGWSSDWPNHSRKTAACCKYAHPKTLEFVF